jgi:TldD protein
MPVSLRSFVDACLDAATYAGASYADVRVVDTSTQSISVRSGRVEAIESASSFGFGVRVIADGRWGFASSSEVTFDTAERIAREAVATAKASALAGGDLVELAPVGAYEGRWSGPCERDPFDVTVDEKLRILLAADKAMRAEEAVKVSEASMAFAKVTNTFGSSVGSYIEQSYVESGAGITAYAIGEAEVRPRSYPNSHGGQHVQGGWETILALDLPAHAPRVAEEAAALLSAKPCPSGRTTLIVDGSQLGLQVHESIGHPTELDRVLGDEAAFAGTSFLTLDDAGSLRYGSDSVTVTADATVAGSLGSFGWDDEGVAACRDVLIERGTLRSFLMSRESALVLGRESNGCMRADGWNRIPIIRMTTVSLEPGDAGTLEDLIADTDEGLYVETNQSWSIDDKRLNFQFATEIGWEIKNGKRGAMVKNPNYTGITPRFWGSCDAVCGREAWQVWGLDNCGKGQPMQVAHVAHGAAPARFRDVEVGVGR